MPGLELSTYFLNAELTIAVSVTPAGTKYLSQHTSHT